MADADIVLKARDLLTPTLSAVWRASEQTSKAFDALASKVSALQTKNETLNKAYSVLQTQLVDAKKAVNEAGKAYKESADEINETNLTKAQEKVKALTDEMKGFKTASADTQKEIRELQNAMRRLDEEGGGSGSENGASGGPSALTAWGAAASGLAKQLGGAVTGAGSYLLQSALGATDAGVVSSILGGAAGGAATGLIAGPVGAAAGAAVGGISGLIEGMTAQAEAEDDAFRAYRDDLVSTVSQNDAEALSAGVATAAQREQDAIAFSALLGNANASSRLLSSLKELANVTPYVYGDLTGIARQLAIFDSTSGDIYGNLVKIGDAGSALGMSASTMEGLAQVLGKIGDSEKYEATYTRSLRNYGINPASVFAEYYGITTAEAGELMSANTKEDRVRELIGTGSFTGADAMEAILSVLDSRYGGMMEQQAITYAGALSTRQGLEAELQNYMGEAYTESRALAEHNEWMQNMYASDAYAVVGKALAHKENYEDAIKRDVWNGVFLGEKPSVVDEKVAGLIEELHDEYVEKMAEQTEAEEAGDTLRADKAGAQVQKVLMEMDALVQSAQDTDEKLQFWDDMAEDLVHDTGRIAGILEAYKDSWALAKRQEEGLAAVASAVDATLTPARYTGTQGQIRSAVSRGETSVAAAPSAVGTVTGAEKTRSGRSAGLSPYSSAVGKHVIPYDGFPILAHEGEMLLTASEAREVRDGGVNVTISGNTFVVRQESDIDEIAERLAWKIRLAQLAKI